MLILCSGACRRNESGWYKKKNDFHREIRYKVSVLFKNNRSKSAKQGIESLISLSLSLSLQKEIQKSKKQSIFDHSSERTPMVSASSYSRVTRKEIASKTDSFVRTNFNPTLVQSQVKFTAYVTPCNVSLFPANLTSSFA